MTPKPEPAPVGGEAFSKGYKHRHGEPVSDACGEGRHSECTQDFTKCHCTFRCGHTTMHAYMNPVPAPKAEPDAFHDNVRKILCGARPERVAGAYPGIPTGFIPPEPSSPSAAGEPRQWLIDRGEFKPYDPNATYAVSGHQIEKMLAEYRTSAAPLAEELARRMWEANAAKTHHGLSWDKRMTYCKEFITWAERALASLGAQRAEWKEKHGDS